MSITQQEAEQILAHDLVSYEDTVERVVKVKLKQNQFDALVSLCFNIGPGAFATSSVVRRINNGDWLGAGNAFRMWNKGTVNGKRVVIQGLVNRRERERKLFLGL